MTVLLFAFEYAVSMIYPLIGKEGSYILDVGNSSSWRALIMPITTLLLVLFIHGRNIITIGGIEKLLVLLLFLNFYLEVVDQVGTSFSAIYRLKMLFSVSIVLIIPLAVSKIRNKDLRLILLLFFILLNFVSFLSSSNAFGGIHFI